MPLSLLKLYIASSNGIVSQLIMFAYPQQLTKYTNSTVGSMGFNRLLCTDNILLEMLTPTKSALHLGLIINIYVSWG